MRLLPLDVLTCSKHTSRRKIPSTLFHSATRAVDDAVPLCHHQTRICVLLLVVSVHIPQLLGYFAPDNLAEVQTVTFAGAHFPSGYRHHTRHIDQQHREFPGAYSVGQWGRKESWEQENIWLQRRGPLPEAAWHMQRPSPTVEQHQATSSGTNDPSSGRPEPQAREPAETTVSQQGPSLPSVAALTAHDVAGTRSAVTPHAESPATVRAFGVHSILNPAAEVQPLRLAPRMTQSPARSVSANLGPQPSPLVSPRVRKRRDETSPRRAHLSRTDIGTGRRLLTPKSPALRSMSQGTRGSPSSGGRRNVSHSHREDCVYTAEPGGSASGAIPPLPPMHTGPLGQFSSQNHEYGTNLAPTNYSSSTASYSANTQGQVGSPASSSNLGLAEREASPFRTPFFDSSAPSGFAPVQDRSATRTYGVGQPAYQMELSTEGGTMIVPVEVDVQQASKLADEKRKRNAGASARFRQRRKEKEHAASQHIADLQKQVRDMTEERDHYLSERNVFRDLVARAPGLSVPPRPPSPRLRRQGHYASSVPLEPPANVEYGLQDVGEPSPAQRRRTSDYQPTFGAAQHQPPPLPSAVPTSYAPSYSTTQSSSYSLPPPLLPPNLQDTRNHHPPSSLPGHLPGHHPLHVAPPPPPPNPVRPQSYDPFRRETNPR